MGYVFIGVVLSMTVIILVFNIVYNSLTYSNVGEVIYKEEITIVKKSNSENVYYLYISKKDVKLFLFFNVENLSRASVSYKTYKRYQIGDIILDKHQLAS